MVHKSTQLSPRPTHELANALRADKERTEVKNRLKNLKNHPHTPRYGEIESQFQEHLNNPTASLEELKKINNQLKKIQEQFRASGTVSSLGMSSIPGTFMYELKNRDVEQKMKHCMNS
jgi:hypothetical protein